MPPKSANAPSANPVPSHAHASSYVYPYDPIRNPTTPSQLLTPNAPKIPSITALLFVPEPAHTNGSPAQSYPSAAAGFPQPQPKSYAQSASSPKLHAVSSSHVDTGAGSGHEHPHKSAAVVPAGNDPGGAKPETSVVHSIPNKSFNATKPSAQPLTITAPCEAPATIPATSAS